MNQIESEKEPNPTEVLNSTEAETLTETEVDFGLIDGVMTFEEGLIMKSFSQN